MKKGINTLLLIYIIVVITALLTFIVPAGEYQREVKNGKTVVVPNSYRELPEKYPQGIGAMILAPIKGFEKAAEIIVFILIIGGAFMIIQKTGAIDLGLKKLAFVMSEKPSLQKYFIPVTMTAFSLAGSLFGMCEETMPFVLIFIPLAITLGYDSLVGTAIPFLGAAAGFAGAILNPFTLGIALKISELPYDIGLWYRVLIWLISTVSMIFFVVRYANKIKKNPQLSPVYDIDRARNINTDISSDINFTKQHKIILAVFALGMVVMVIGILEFGWFILEIAGLFMVLGFVSGAIAKMDSNTMIEYFKEGARDFVGVAFIIACAKGLLVIATDGKIIDTMLYSMSNLISGLHPVLAAQMMFITQGTINFFVHSGSGQAALTMPVMAPLADVLNIPRFAAVLAFQFGEGWINPILPTSGVTMGVLGLAGIPYNKWFKWLLYLQIYFFILALILLIPSVIIKF